MKNDDEEIEKLRQRNLILEQNNKELQEQNEKLKNEFDQAIQLSSKIENVYQDNNNYQKKMKKLKNEKDDLEKRLLLSNKTIEELKKQINEINNLNDIQEQIKSSLNNNTNDNSHIVQELQNKINQMEMEYKNTLSEKTKLDFDIHQIFQISSQYFEKQISCTSDLLNMYIKNDKKELVDVNKDNDKTNLKFVKKANKYKGLYIETNKKNGELISQIERNKQINNELKDQLQLLKQKFEKQQHENEEINGQKEKVVNENLSLKADLKLHETKQNQTTTETVVKLNKKISKLTEIIKEKEEENRMMKQSIAKLVKKIKTLQEDINKQKINIEEITLNNQKILKQKDYTISEMETKFKDCESKIKKITENSNKQKNDLNQVILEKQSAKDEIASYISENDKLNKEIEKLMNCISQQNSSFQQKVDDYENKISELKTINLETQKKLDIASCPTDVSKLITLAAISCKEMPGDLISSIENIVNNESSELPTKLKNVLSLTCKWFTSRTVKNEEDISDKNDKLLKLNFKLSSLIEYFKKELFPGFKFNLDDILENDATRVALSEYIKGLNNELSNANESKDTLNEQIEDFCLFLQIDSFNKAKNVIIELKKNIKIFSRKYQKIKNEYKTLLQRNKEKDETLNTNISTQEKMINDINEKFKILSSEKSELEKSQCELNQTIKKMNDTIKQMEEENQKLQEKTDEQLKNLEFEKNNNSNLKDELANLLEQNKSLNNQIQQLQSQIEEIKKHYKIKIKSEREQNKAHFNQMLEEMKNKNNECCKSIQQLNTVIVNQKEEIEKLNSTIFELNLKSKQFETKIKSAISEERRNFKLKESQMHATKIALETEYKALIKEKNQEIPTFKNNLFTLLNQTFSSILSQHFNENNFEDMLKQISLRIMQMKNLEFFIRNKYNFSSDTSTEEIINRIEKS